jgi:hypothetical protein
MDTRDPLGGALTRGGIVFEAGPIRTPRRGGLLAALVVGLLASMVGLAIAGRPPALDRSIAAGPTATNPPVRASAATAGVQSSPGVVSLRQLAVISAPPADGRSRWRVSVTGNVLVRAALLDVILETASRWVIDWQTVTLRDPYGEIHQPTDWSTQFITDRLAPALPAWLVVRAYDSTGRWLGDTQSRVTAAPQLFKADGRGVLRPLR